ncbi:MAG: lipase family protein, partial [Peptococcaceae bacterium]|nr:lipase family protein [Peptococcaceae bacterium]
FWDPIIGPGGGTGEGGFKIVVDDWDITIYPISKDVYLIIYGEVGWLKEMFHVQLLLTNTSAVDYIDNCVAELKLPSGLSFATMTSSSGKQNVAFRTIGKIAELESVTVDWYVRGDREGEYHLTADVSGTYMPNPEDFAVSFTTERPIKVLAGSALHLYVEAERNVRAKEDYRLLFRLVNVSDKPVYNLHMDIFGGGFAERFSVYDVIYGEVPDDLAGTWNNGLVLQARELAPGETIAGMFIIKFEDDLIEQNRDYMLTNIFSITRDGSTTEIPITFIIVDSLEEDMYIYEPAQFLEVGETKTMSGLTDFGAYGLNPDNWRSLDTAIVTVATGTVTAHKVGSTSVTFYNPGTRQTHVFTITVYDPNEQVTKRSGKFWYSNDGNRANYQSNYNYDDSFFYNPAEEYNHDLATLSLNFAMTAFARYGTPYQYKSDNVRDFLYQTGFKDFETNQGFKERPGPDSIGVAAAHKSITDDRGRDFTLVAVAIRGAGYESEWASNFKAGVNPNYHDGFKEASDEVVRFLEDYIMSRNDISGSIKLWITGYSRAAATANITAGRYSEGSATIPGVTLWPHNIYAYCFETPAGVLPGAFKGSFYDNIFSIINPSDPVPKVAPSNWGFTVYGNRIYLPSPGTSGWDYDGLKTTMLGYFEQLSGFKKSDYTVDNFMMKKWNFNILNDDGLIADDIVDNVNSRLTQDIFLYNLLRYLTNDIINNRSDYVHRLQDGVVETFKVVNNDQSEEIVQRFCELFSDKAGKTIKNHVGSRVVFGVAAAIFDDNLIDKLIKDALDSLYQSLSEYGIEGFSRAELEALAKDVVDVFVKIILFEQATYTVTLINNVGSLGNAHYPELCLAWMQSSPTLFSKLSEGVFIKSAI